MKQLSKTASHGLFVALAALMLATRFHHFGTALHLPDASMAIFFLGGWLSPFHGMGIPLLSVDGWWWLFAKVFFFASCFIWFRASFPRYRYDQIMRLGWKVFIPLTLIWIAVVGFMMMEPFASDYFSIWFGRQP